WQSRRVVEETSCSPNALPVRSRGASPCLLPCGRKAPRRTSATACLSSRSPRRDHSGWRTATRVGLLFVEFQFDLTRDVAHDHHIVAVEVVQQPVALQDVSTLYAPGR